MRGPGMNLFRSRKKFNVSERDPTYKVRYLGNIQTSMMRGEGCTDKAAGILWNNFLKNGGGLDMKLTICASGLKALTKEQGFTDYRAHRISYCIAHPLYPRLFLWVYRHEGKKMKVELRCHAVLCRKVEKARAMAVQLHDKLTSSLAEFVRDKTRRQNSRLTIQRTNSLPSCATDTHGIPLRRQILSTATNFKPPVDCTNKAPKLGSITEDYEPEVVEEEEEEEEEEDVEEEDCVVRKRHSRDDSYLLGISPHSESDLELHRECFENGLTSLESAIFDFELGNDVAELKEDAAVQFQLRESQLSSDDDDSSESGYSEQDATGSTGSYQSACSRESTNGNDVSEGQSDEGTGSLSYLPSPIEDEISDEVVVLTAAL